MKETTVLISCLLFSIFYFNGSLAQSPSIVSANSSLSFAQQNILITVTFNQQVSSNDFVLNNFLNPILIDDDLLPLTLSNSSTFTSPNCTFLVFADFISNRLSTTHNFTLGLLYTNEIKLGIGNNPDIECLSGINSTYLELFVRDSDFLPSSLISQLNVIPDSTPPQVSFFTINFQLGVIVINFLEPIIVETLNISGFFIQNINSQTQVSSLFPLSSLTNSDVNSDDNSLSSLNAVIFLEIFELSMLSSLCPSNASCIVQLPSDVSIVSDVFGNVLVEPIPSAIRVGLANLFVESEFTSSLLRAIPVSSNQVILSFSIPANLRPSDRVSYRIFVFPEAANYYRGSCDFVYGYRNQLDREKRSISPSLVCQNSTEYSCYITEDSSLVVSITEGFDTIFLLDTVYPNIQFNASGNNFILSTGDFYKLLLEIEFFQDLGSQPTEIPLIDNLTDPFPLKNRALLEWKVPDLSFCDEHRITIRYPDPISAIDLDDETVCGSQFVYVYLPDGGSCRTGKCIDVEVRIISPSVLLPNGTCAYATIPLFGSLFVEFQEFENRPTRGISLNFFNNMDGVDIPVVESITTYAGLSEVLSHLISWSYFPLSPFDYFNVYVFPVYGLQYDGGSCDNIDFQTSNSEFSFYPTEYYKYGVSIPNQADFNLSCPTNSELSLPYECYSAFSYDRQISVNISTQFAVGVIVEAVFFTAGNGARIKVQSYPAIYSAWSIDRDSTQGRTYQRISWDTNLCLDAMSSVLFMVSELELDSRRSIGSTDPTSFHGNYLIPCTNTPALITELPAFFAGTGYIFNELQIGNKDLCLSGLESIQVDRFSFTQDAAAVDFKYTNYFTLSLSIPIDGEFNQPASVQIIPSTVNSVSINASQFDICPIVVNGQLPAEYLITSFQVNVSNFFSPICENTTSSTCVFVENTSNLTFNVTPGFNNQIFVGTTGQILSLIPGSTDPMFRIPTISDPDLLESQKLLYTNVRLVSNNSILVEWDTDFYCPPGSYMNIYFEMENDRREVILEDEENIPCQVGRYMLENTKYSAVYSFYGTVFFNSTTIFPSCPTLSILFDFVKTPEFIQIIELIDFENVYVQWDSVAGVSSYTLLAVPKSIMFFQDPIGSVYSSSTFEQFFDYTSSVPIDVIFQMCLNSSEDLTCSKLTTSNTNAIISILPGYAYSLAVAYELQNNITIQPESFYDPEKDLEARTTISEFNNILLYNYSAEICTNNVRTVFFYSTFRNNPLLFRVDSCQNSTSELPVTDFPNTTPLVLFIFPYQEVRYPGTLSFLIPPASVAILTEGIFSRLPGAAAPVLTTVQPPVESSSNLYQAQWTDSPSFPIAQEFESYTLYALPFSRNFTLSGEACPQFIYPGCFFGSPITPLQERSIIFDLCPYSGNFYFCQEFSTAIEGQIALFPLLDYSFFVESQFDGGLRAYFIEDGINVVATQDLMESLNLTYQVTTVSIEIQWDTSAAFCADSTLAFLYQTQINPSISVACTVGSYSIEPLQPNTEYEILLYFDYDPTRLYPGPDQCIRNRPIIAFNPFPVTFSVCLTQQPCDPFGMCSEGFSNNSFHCDCLTGYEFNGNTCVDINECSADINPCNNGACANTEGSFTCTCYEGFELVNNQCVDINECDIPDSCINGECTNLLPPDNYRCECQPLFDGRTCNISVETPTCPSFTEANEFGDDVTFPATPRGEDALVSCSQLDITLFGSISKRCNNELEYEATNFNNCVSATFLSLQVSRTQNGGLFSSEESIAQSLQLASATDDDNRVLFPGEINEAVAGLEAITNSLTNLTGAVLTSTLAQVQDNVVTIASNIFRGENMAVILATPQTQTQSLASVVVLSVETLGTLIGSVLPVNTSLVIDSTNAALVVAVVSDPDEPLVIGPNSNIRGNQSALVRAQASVSIPASVIRANDIGNGVEVSFSVFPNLAELLGEVSANVSLTARETSINDTLGTGISNLNIFTRGGGRVEQLNEDILLTFGLIFDPPILANSIKFRIVYSCVSSRFLDEGWVGSGTTLSNEEEVPPGPAECSVSHLTNFAVLVSARSLNFTPGETLALKILSYVTGILSILFLLVSIAAYIILWWRTRKQSTSLFKKDATILHFNFAVALFLALIFFMASAGAYDNRTACLAMTIIQYYFWLSVFTASLSIGIYLLIKITAWNVERRLWHFLVIFSWSIPVPFLIITPSLTHSYIIDDVDEICWLSNEPKYASLAFIIPMVVITSINLIFLIITSVILFRASKGNKSIYTQVRSVLFATLLLAPLLGIPWLFSIVASLPTPATAFIFAIVLGLQGVLFSILYPLRTPEIIKYVFLWKPTHGESLQKYSSSNTGTKTTGPSALKFRINRKPDNTNSGNVENVYSQAKPSIVVEASEAPNELLDIKLEPVTIESSIRSISMRPNLKDTEMQKLDTTTAVFEKQISEPHYTKSIPADNDEFQGSLSLKLPYHSLSIDEADQ